MGRIGTVLSLALIPLIPTVILWYAFENTAQYNTDTYKLGGSIAAYFVLFSAMSGLYKVISVDERKKTRGQLKGDWYWRATSNDLNGNVIAVRTGSVTISDDKGQLALNGSTKGIDGSVAIDFSADEIVLTASRLIYCYSLADQTRTGITILRFEKDSKARITGLGGRWVATGDAGHGGVKFQRTPFPDEKIVAQVPSAQQRPVLVPPD